MNLKGRPSLYNPSVHIPVVAFYAQEGLTVEQIAQRIGVNQATLYDWCKVHPELNEALKTTREEADSKVVQSLYKKALAGDTTAMIFWLKNRQPAKWREKQEIETTVMGDVAVAIKRILDA
jgi:transposase-like protein